MRQEFNVLAKWRYGQILYNRNDRYIGNSLSVYGEYSEGEVSIFRQLLGPGMVVLDIGANIGCHTIPISEMVGEAGWVYAFEPQRIVFQTLCANLALNSVENVIALPFALGAEMGTLRQMNVNYQKENNFGGVPLGNDQCGEIVEVRTLDSLDIPACAFIKIDVEGMEQQVLEGAKNLLARDRPWLYVENDRADHSESLKRYIHKLGYEMYWHTPPMFNLDNFNGFPEDIFKLESVNMLCVPSELKVRIDGLTPVALG